MQRIITAAALAFVLTVSAADAIDDRIPPPPGSSIVIHLTRDNADAHHRHAARRHHTRIRHARATPQHRAVATGTVEPVGAAPAPDIVRKARAFLGRRAAELGLRRSLWCSAFMRMITNARGVDDRAISWLRRPHRAPSVGSVAVMPHHVGVVSGFDRRGNPRIVSGNHGGLVAEAVYPRYRVLAYVAP